MALLTTISEEPSRRTTRTVVDCCYHLAHAYLTRRRRRGALALHLFGISLDDLALDCIADLFERDEHGRFTQLNQYFSSRRPEAMTEAQLTTALRRLVYSKVGEALFRRYRDADPSLGKLIRNLGYAQEHDARVHTTRKEGAKWFVFDGGTSVPSGAIMGPELLETRIMCGLEASSSLKMLLTRTGQILRQYEQYVPAYPVVGLAMVLRRAFRRLADAPKPAHVSMHHLHTIDMMSFLIDSVSSMKDHFHGTYVGKKKTSLPTYNAYFDATRDILLGLCIDDRRVDASYFDHLRRYVMDLSYDEYRQHHRVRLEYIVRQTRRHFLDGIARHW